MLFPPHMRPCGGLLPAPECPPRGKPRAELLADWSPPGAAKPVNSALNDSAFQFRDYAGRECSSPLGEGSARPAHGRVGNSTIFCGPEPFVDNNRMTAALRSQPRMIMSMPPDYQKFCTKPWPYPPRW